MANRIAPLKIKNAHIVPSLHTIPSTRFRDVFLFPQSTENGNYGHDSQISFTSGYFQPLSLSTQHGLNSWSHHHLRHSAYFDVLGQGLKSAGYAAVAYDQVWRFMVSPYLQWLIYIYIYVANIYSTWNHHESWVDSNSPGLRWIESGITGM